MAVRLPFHLVSKGGVRKGGAHQPNECVNIDDLITYVKITALTMMDWCGYNKKTILEYEPWRFPNSG